MRFLLAASAVLVAIAASWLALNSSGTTIKTDRAERREVVLADGSVVGLEPETGLHVILGKHRRDVVLTRGRALFHVSKDAARPFTVHAGDTNVRALGTIFGVEQRNQNVIVTVSEGKVAVAPTSQLQSDTSRSSSSFSLAGKQPQPAQPVSGAKDGEANVSPHARPLGRVPGTLSAHSGPEPGPTEEGGNASASGQGGEIFLAADEQVTVKNSGDATPVQKVDAGRALAWAQGRLVFDSTPLSEVADEFNRYNRVQLRIGSPELARRTISGVFQASDPQTLIDFIGAGAHVIVRRHGNDAIVISSGP